MGINTYSTNANNNTASPPNGAPEGMAPSTVNNTIRQVMADIRSFYQSADFIDLGHTPTYASSASFRLAGDQTSFYTANRPIYCSDTSSIYGYVVSSTYSSPNTTVTISPDSGFLTTAILSVSVSLLDPSNKHAASSIGFIQSGTGAVATDLQTRGRDVILLSDFLTASQKSDTTLDVSAALQAADDAAATLGAIIQFQPRGYNIAAQVNKSPYTTWIGHPNSQYGVTANDAIGTSGSRIYAGYNGTLVKLPATGSDVYCGYTGIRWISFFNDPAIYASCKAIDIGTHNRQMVFADALIKGFLYGIYGSSGELYIDRIFADHCKYSAYLFSIADSWITRCHLGSGSQTTYPAGGIGCTIINGSNIYFDHTRFQVQRAGYGVEIQSCSNVNFSECIIDQNDLNGGYWIDSNNIKWHGGDIFDNGTTGVNAYGVNILAQGYDFTADSATDVITLASGSATWASGNTQVELTTTGTLPAGLSTGTTYYVIAVNSTTTFKLASNVSNARAGTAIDITDAGTGTHTIHAVCSNIEFIGGMNQDRNQGTAAQRQTRSIVFAKSAGGGKIRKINILGHNMSKIDQGIGGASSVDSELRIEDCPGFSGISSDNGDSGTTLTIGTDAPTQIWATTLTNNRSVSLDTTGGYQGASWKVIRETAAAGAYTLSVGGLISLNPGEWCLVKYDGSAWILDSYGSLSQVYVGSATYDPPSLVDGAGTTTTVTVTGAVVGDYVEGVSFSLDLQGITLTGYVSGSDTVSVRFQNESGGTLDLASGTLRARVRKH